MPFARVSNRAVAAAPSLAVRAVRALVTLLVAGFAAFALLLLAVRYVVFPQVGAYRDTLASQLARELGQPVELGALTTAWDGWNPKLVLHDFRVLDRMRAGAAPLLELPEVELTVAWTSLPLLELRLKELAIDRPRLAVRRDRAGMLHVAGLELDPSQSSDDTRFTDWLLRQPHIEVRGALVTWNDDLRNAPQLVLDRVQLRLESHFNHHRFGLTGTPPTELAAPLDLRGEWHGGSLAGWREMKGRVYARLDYADIAAWREWLPLPLAIASGKGALRMWFEFENGEARDIVADLALADVRARLRDDLPELSLATLAGRVGAKYGSGKRELYLRELAFATPSGEQMQPSNATLSLRDADGATPSSGRFQFDRLELAPLRDLAVHLPLPERLRAELARFAPRGTLSKGHAQWSGDIDAPATFDVAADFDNFGVVAQDSLPGLRDVDGRLTATHTGGELKLSAHPTALDLPHVFVEPVALDTFAADVSWERKGEQTIVRLERVDFANGDAAGTASGTWRSLAQGPGEIDLAAQLSRADPRSAHKYLPRAVSERARAWLARALIDGSATDTRLKLAGNLAHFPFADGRSGQFIVTAKAKAVTLDFAGDWPAITAIDGDFKVDGVRMTIDATRGRVYGADVGRTRAEIPDLRGPHRVLRIDGTASGPTADFLRYVESSPVGGWIGHVATDATASGNGSLALKLELPIGSDVSPKVAGEYSFDANEIRLRAVPALDKVSGKIAFTEGDVHARDVNAEALGGPVRINVAATAGTGERLVRINANGTASVATLKRELDVPGADRLSGTADWTLALDLRDSGATWIVESPMKGAAVDLPAPLGKAAAVAMPLRIERRFDPKKPNEDTLAVSYGRIAQLAAHRRLAASSADIDRAQVVVGRGAERPDAARADRAGLWVRGDVPALNVDDWLALIAQRKAASSGGGGRGTPAVAGIDLDVAALDAMGRRLTDIKVSARPSGDDWKLDLDGREVTGSATWHAPNADAPNGRVVARLSRLAVPAAGELHAWSGAQSSADTQDSAAGTRWPGIDIVAETFASRGGHELGRLELAAQPRGGEWRIEKLAVVNDAGRIDANGAWRASGRSEQTKLDIAVDVKEAGAFLARFGYPDALRNAPTKIDGQLAWAGPPHAFDYPTLGGAFHVHSGAGRFTKVEPGLGKLLGVLSLQALPRRVSLDFTDVFSEGFTFDSIDGDVRVQNGVMSTPGLRLAGPSAKVVIAGETDLAQETQRLSVRVQPALSGSVSTGAALLFFANPVVGAAVGAGSLLAQKIMKDPIEQMFSYDYTVTGSWSDPVVTRGRTATTAFAPSPEAAPR
jgi:uncharacterized protein (TIGR02099 family)